MVRLSAIIRKYQRFVKFCIVGGSGAIITFGATWLLTELLGMWYMASMVIAVVIATIWNYNFNLYWTFRTNIKFNDSCYEWESFYNGNPVQKWWKQSIAKTVWSWIPSSDRLLDIGCGSSPIITNYINAVGVDINLDKLKFMRAKCPDIEFTDTINGFNYDSILCIEVLEHLENPEIIIYDISKRVKNNGKVVFATPDYKKRLWHIAEKFTPYKDNHYTKLDKELLEKMCIKNRLYPIRHKYIAGCDLIEMFEKR